MKRRMVISPQYLKLQEFIVTLEREFDNHGEEIFRRRNVVKIFTYGGIEMAVKWYKSPNIFQKILIFLGKKTKARKAYENGIRLKELGFNTPEPIGFIETFRLRIPQKSFFITTKVDEVPLKDIILSKVNIDHNIDQLAQFVARLHKNNVFFRDLNMDNILVDPNDIDQKKFVLIDTNRAHFCKMTQRRRAIDIARLSRQYWVIEGFISRYSHVMNSDVDSEKRVIRSVWVRREVRNRLRNAIRGIV